MVALQQTKEVAVAVEERLAETQLTQEEVNAARRKFQPVSHQLHSKTSFSVQFNPLVTRII